MGDGVFLYVRLAFEGGRLAAWKKQPLRVKALKLPPAVEALADELDSEIFGSQLSIQSAVEDADAARRELEERGFTIPAEQVRSARRMEVDGRPWWELQLKGELGPRSKVSSLITLLKNAAKHGELYCRQRISLKNGTYELTGYTSDWDAWTYWGEALLRSCLAASLHGGEGVASFVADAELLDPPMYHGLRVTGGGVELTSLDPDDYSEAQEAAILGIAPEAVYDTIRGAYEEWVGGSGEARRRKRVSGRAGHVSPAGEWLGEPRWSEVRPFWAERAAVQQVLWGYLDPAGEVVVEPRYMEAGDFQEGLARVRLCTHREQTGEAAWQETWKYQET